MKSSKLEKVTKVLAKLAEIAHWIGAVGMLVGLVLTFVMGSDAVFFDPGDAGRSVSIYGFEMIPVSAQGAVDMAVVRMLTVAGFFLMVLMAMVFRNVWLILKNSESTTPFQPDNIRMVREIGWFLMGVPVVSLIMSVIARLALGTEIETSVDMAGILVGLVVLCLSQVFARGMALESDVDGLV